ncbi:MAG TPA: HAD hydrolase family protein [Candidatus Gastranaerophilales bacterium]|nr:HAD hydrolase family protein [Candidatus Gastranaerophilales bacterium]
MIQNQYIDNPEDKIARIKLFAFDVDGVLTNGEIIYTDKGEEIKIFNAKDGQGIANLVKNNYITAVITARESFIVDKRANDLNIKEVYQGIKNKFKVIEILMQKYNLELSEIAYTGDDLPDICVLEKVGLAFCPYDAVEEVKQICHFISSKEGGKGAVREITDLLIKNKKTVELF